MGISGLTTFLNAQKGLFDKHRLHSTTLVIDGSSLAAQLHCASARRAPFTGDYDSLARDFAVFFDSLKTCDIRPIVICDGGYPHQKIKTAVRRLATRTKDSLKITPTTFQSYTVFPLMLRDVFFQVMNNLQIEFVICNLEADREVAAIAKHFNAAVLSYDSDFFIYNVAYIPINSLELKPTVHKKDKTFALDCKVFLPSKFEKIFHIKLELVPLMATLLGNDYVKRSTFSKFFHNISMESRISKNSLGQNRIYALFNWLKNETYESAVESVVNRYKIHQRFRIQGAIKRCCQIYTNLQSFYIVDFDINQKNQDDSIEKYKDDELNIDEVEIVDDSITESSDDDSSNETDFESLEKLNVQLDIVPFRGCPQWLCDLFKKGKLSPRFIDLYYRFTYIGTPQVEDSNYPDAHTCAFPILRYSYELINSFRNHKDVTFIGRKRFTIHKMKVPRYESLSWKLLNRLKDCDKSPDGEFFLYFLETNLPKNIVCKVLLLPLDIQIFVLSIIWLKTRPTLLPVFTDLHVYSLILNFIMLSIVFDKVGGRQSKDSFLKKHGKTIEEIKKGKSEEISVEFKSLKLLPMNENDCILAAGELLKFFDIDKQICSNKKSLNRTTLHTFSQFQCCLQHLYYLNNLTSNPFGSSDISKSFNGTFMYNIHTELCKRKNPYNYILQVLKHSPSVCAYFKIVTEFITPIVPKSVNLSMNSKMCNIVDDLTINVIKNSHTFVLFIICFICMILFKIYT